MATTQQNTAWPEGVIARYLTTAGATVDITHTSHSTYLIATCAGCGQDEYTETGGRPHNTPEEEEWRVENVLPASRSWARDHAEKCGLTEAAAVGDYDTNLED